MTHYEVLGVAPTTATDGPLIEAAFRRCVLATHPDRQEGSSSSFLAVTEARRVLSDPCLRRQYDQGLAMATVRAAGRVSDTVPRKDFATDGTYACRCGGTYVLPGDTTTDRVILECPDCSLVIAVV